MAVHQLDMLIEEQFRARLDGISPACLLGGRPGEEGAESFVRVTVVAGERCRPREPADIDGVAIRRRRWTRQVRKHAHGTFSNGFEAVKNGPPHFERPALPC